MKLSQLLSVYPQLWWGDQRQADVSSIQFDSRKAEQGCVFVALRGQQADGHEYLPEVIEKGAIALVVEDKAKVPDSFTGAYVVVDDTRAALDLVAARFYGYPAKDLFCVGVTGTNGKTSVTYMIEHIFNEFDWPTGVMGTIDHHLKEHRWESALTTPEPVTLQKRLHEFVTLKAKTAVFEVSSHALVQKRVDQIPFDAVVFTNLSRDHLDYHGDMEDYFKAKQRLFGDVLWKTHKPQPVAVINSDDRWGQRIQVAEKARRWTYGQGDCHFCFEVLEQDFNGSVVNLQTPRGETQVFVPIPGLHNVYNGVAAIAVAMAAGVSLDKCVEAMHGFSGVPGRLQPVPNDLGFHILVDYAHTDDALTSVLQNLQSLKSQTGSDVKVITVFGCGGDRDRGKRPMMAGAALKNSDRVIMTSDNPRTEDPVQIIEDGLKAVPPDLIDKSFFVEVDRRQAISKALGMAQKGDVILIAGKGHEDYQVVGTEKRSFSDMIVAQELISEM